MSQVHRGCEALAGVLVSSGQAHPSRRLNLLLHLATYAMANAAESVKPSREKLALFALFLDRQRTQTQSSARAHTSLRQPMDVRFCKEAGTTAKKQTCAAMDPDQTSNALSGARPDTSCFSLASDLHTWRFVTHGERLPRKCSFAFLTRFRYFIPLFICEHSRPLPNVQVRQ